jgi:nucleoside-diphosphate-sugar epimerase
MPVFAVTGASTSLGSRVVPRLEGAGRVIVLGPATDATAALAGVDVLVTLAEGPCPTPVDGDPATRLADLRLVLDAASKAGVGRIVHLSSAVVYGARDDNPVPLPDDAPVRPDPRFGWAVELAEAERLVAEWRDDNPGTSAAVLRPALVVADDDDGFLARALGGITGPRSAGEERPVQFVHVDDLADAVALCALSVEPVDDVLNVAPEGWIDDSEVAALAGAAIPRPPIPARLVGPARRLLWRLGIGTVPPGAEAYANNPWVVAADRIRELGWSPQHDNAEALVATTTASPLASLSPRRRQELLLAIVAVLAVAGIAGTVLAVRRAIRNHRAT